MSNTKQNSVGLRQSTLQINQTAPSKSSLVPKKKAPTPSKNIKRKPEIHEIINLEQEEFMGTSDPSNKDDEAFVSQLAKKCGAFFSWINQVDYSIFGEQLWKNKMMAVVGQRFPELNTDEHQKIIDRDWKIMAPQIKSQILADIQKEISPEQFQRMLFDFQNQRNQVYLEANAKNMTSNPMTDE